MGKGDSTLILIVLAVAGYFILKGKSVVKTQYAGVTTAVQNIQDEYMKRGGTYTTTDSKGEPLPEDRGFSTQHSTKSFPEFLKKQPLGISIPVFLGTLENSIIDYVSGGTINPMRTATEAGAEFRIALEEGRDVERFETAKDIWGRSLITIGEGFGRTVLGWSPYEAGQDVARWWNS